MNRKENLSFHEYRFIVVYEPAEEGGFVVTCPALPAVVTQGETLEEARAMAADAIHLVLQDLLEAGEPIPSDASARPAHEPICELLTVAVQGV